MEQLRSIRVCDCFLDVAIYCFPKDLLYANFCHECLEVKNDKRNSFMIMSIKNDQQDCFIAF